MPRKGLGLTPQILIGMGLGIVLGIVLNWIGPGNWTERWLTEGVLRLLGSGFINLIKMMVVPLVFVTLVAGACNIGDTRKLGRVGVKALGFYLITTCIAISLAILLGEIFTPGSGLDLSAIVSGEIDIKETEPLIDILLNMIPTNPVGALAEAKMLQIIVFALFVGISLALIGKRGKAAIQLFDALNELVLKMIHIVMLFAPYGVFALVARTFAVTGFDAMKPLAGYMLVVVTALFAHMMIVYLGLLAFLGRLSPVVFVKKFFPAMSVAFSTASSSATLPLTLEMVEQRMGVSRGVASFTLPMGATINMDGTAIMQGVAAVFISQVYLIDLSLGNMLTIVLTATLASVGTAGVPSVGLVTLAMVLRSVGLPLEGIGLIIGIDRLLDMCRTATNITGDAVCTLIIARSENELNLDQFYSEISDDE